jgi:ABC-type dipeptide/oligopeptide/nickel transport system permease subunit
MLCLIIMGIIGPYVAPHDPLENGVATKFSGPAWGDHLLGADRLGRDVLSRLLHGARISLIVGVASAALGTLVGAVMGLVSGYIGGKTDVFVQRLIDMLMSLPVIILAMALLTSMDRTVNTIILAIAVPMIPYGARVVRASTLVIKENQYVEAARAIGCSDLRIMWRHIAPGCIAPYIVVATSLIGVAIITEAALGFLGLSVAPPTATWGEMISKAMNELTFAAHLSVAPGIAITLAVFAFNMIGDALRDLLDPRLRGRAQ